MKFGTKIIFFLLTILLLASCSGYEQLIKGNDFDAKYKAAVEYYNQKDYNRALQLLENLMLHYHGKENAENIAWYYAQSLLKTSDYYSAAYQFKSFFKRYPYSEHAEEALYLSADCKYQQSPAYYLDQKVTKEAIQEYESFVDRYPTSVYIPEINDHLDELRSKLMLKDYEIAYNYYHIESYHAAYVSLQAFLNNYPESPYREKAMFYMLSSGYEYGINSQESKMQERLQQVVADFERFSPFLTDPQFVATAQSIYTKSKAALAELEKSKNTNK